MDIFTKTASSCVVRSAVQSITKMADIALRLAYHPRGLTHTWVTYYDVRVTSSQACINDW